MANLQSTLFLFTHVVAVAIAVIAVTIVDIMGIFWMLGRKPMSELTRIFSVAQVFIWTAWAGLVVSGVGIVLTRGSVEHLDILKLFVVLMVGLNGLGLYFLARELRLNEHFKTISAAHKYHLITMSIVSLFGWWIAFGIGLIQGYRPQPTSWPPHPWTWVFSIAGVWALLVIIGHVWLGRSILSQKKG